MLTKPGKPLTDGDLCVTAAAEEVCPEKINLQLSAFWRAVHTDKDTGSNSKPIRNEADDSK